MRRSNVWFEWNGKKTESLQLLIMCFICDIKRIFVHLNKHKIPRPIDLALIISKRHQTVTRLHQAVTLSTQTKIMKKVHNFLFMKINKLK